MIKKYCDMCERKIEKGLSNILETNIKIGKYFIRLQHCQNNKSVDSTCYDKDSPCYANGDALCAQCFLTVFVEAYKDQLNLKNKDLPGMIDTAKINL